MTWVLIPIWDATLTIAEGNPLRLSPGRKNYPLTNAIKSGIIPIERTKGDTKMKMLFKIVYISTETDEQIVRFARTLEVAHSFVKSMTAQKKGKDFKIIPIKLK
jgi:hypothetical protein